MVRYRIVGQPEGQGRRQCRDHHDGEHEQHQHHGPEAKDDFDLAEQVPQARMTRVRVRQPLEILGGKGVQDGQSKEDGADQPDPSSVSRLRSVRQRTEPVAIARAMFPSSA